MLTPRVHLSVRIPRELCSTALLVSCLQCFLPVKLFVLLSSWHRVQLRVQEVSRDKLIRSKKGHLRCRDKERRGEELSSVRR